MANVTVKILRSDLFPVGTLVKAFAASAKISNGKPSGNPLTEATVDATGLLTLSVPANTAIQCWAEVAGQHRYLASGDPTVVPPRSYPPSLQSRVRSRRAAAGV